MVPVLAMLIGALLIAAGIIFTSLPVTGFRIILSIGGVATLLVGVIMLFSLAKEKK